MLRLTQGFGGLGLGREMDRVDHGSASRPSPAQRRWIEAVAVHDVISTALDDPEDVFVGVVERAMGVPPLAGPDERGRQARRLDPGLDDVRPGDQRTRRGIDIDVVPVPSQPDRKIGDHRLCSALLRLRDSRHQRGDKGDSQSPGQVISSIDGIGGSTTLHHVAGDCFLADDACHPSAHSVPSERNSGPNERIWRSQLCPG